MRTPDHSRSRKRSAQRPERQSRPAPARTSPHAKGSGRSPRVSRDQRPNQTHADARQEQREQQLQAFRRRDQRLRPLKTPQQAANVSARVSSCTKETSTGNSSPTTPHPYGDDGEQAHAQAHADGVEHLQVGQHLRHQLPPCCQRRTSATARNASPSHDTRRDIRMT